MKEYLPIGSVVILVDGEKSLMIYGRKQIHSETSEVLDYVACLYPEGNLDEEHIYLFNHDSIGEVLFRGYVNDKEFEFLKLLDEFEKERENSTSVEEHKKEGFFSRILNR